MQILATTASYFCAAKNKINKLKVWFFFKTSVDYRIKFSHTERRCFLRSPEYNWVHGISSAHKWTSRMQRTMSRWLIAHSHRSPSLLATWPTIYTLLLLLHYTLPTQVTVYYKSGPSIMWPIATFWGYFWWKYLFF